MARVTVEDCLDNVDNRFELVLLATKRARQLAGSAGRRPMDPLLPWENDKPTVMALREIAEGMTSIETVEAAEAKRNAERASALARRLGGVGAGDGEGFGDEDF